VYFTKSVFIETVHVFRRVFIIYFIPMCLCRYLSIYCAMLLIRKVNGCGGEQLTKRHSIDFIRVIINI